MTYNDHPHIFHPVTSAGARLTRNGPERPKMFTFAYIRGREGGVYIGSSGWKASPASTLRHQSYCPGRFPRATESRRGQPCRPRRDRYP
jgi:hypothetical protein